MLNNNYGVQNEYDFVGMFNNKYFNELDSSSKQFLKELFNGYICNDEPIKCWKNKVMQKADIFIKYRNCIKSVSLKCGKNNSMHQESIEEFRRFLEKLGISYNIIEKYASYHYGYMRNNEGQIDFTKSLSSVEYKKLYQDEIDTFNKVINKSKIIIEMIDRFIVRGRNSDYDIDALIVGTKDNYIWIMKYDIYELCLQNKCLEYTSPHIACMTIGPKKRNLERNSNNAKERYLVSIRWNNLCEDIINYKNNNME